MTTIIKYFHTKYFLLPLYVARALGAVARALGALGALGRALGALGQALGAVARALARALGAVARSGQLGRALHDNEVARFLARFVPLLGIGRAQFIFYLRDDWICQSL